MNVRKALNGPKANQYEHRQSFYLQIKYEKQKSLEMNPLDC